MEGEPSRGEGSIEDACVLGEKGVDTIQLEGEFPTTALDPASNKDEGEDCIEALLTPP
jgi:hypothetical protein